MIRGEKVTLRSLEDDDSEMLRGWRNDPELSQYACNAIPISQIEQRTWYDGYAKNKTYQVFIIEDEAKDPIGYCLVKNLDHLNRNAEIGGYLIPKVQGKGYGKDVFKTLMKYCFKELNMHRVYLQVFAFNTRAVQLYEKLGFKIEGTFRDAFFKQGRYQDLVQMSILEAEFKK